MEAIARTVAEFVMWVEDNPHLLDLPTREVLSALRARLDERLPGWREAVFADLPADRVGVEVEMILLENRTVRGTLLQRPSAVDAG